MIVIFFSLSQPLGESEPLKVFHRGLLEMLSTLLQNHTEECLKCIGKILKVLKPLYTIKADLTDT